MRGLVFVLLHIDECQSLQAGSNARPVSFGNIDIHGLLQVNSGRSIFSQGQVCRAQTQVGRSNRRNLDGTLVPLLRPSVIALVRVDPGDPAQGLGIRLQVY